MLTNLFGGKNRFFFSVYVPRVKREHENYCFLFSLPVILHFELISPPSRFSSKITSFPKSFLAPDRVKNVFFHTLTWSFMLYNGSYLIGLLLFLTYLSQPLMGRFSKPHIIYISAPTAEYKIKYKTWQVIVTE